MKRGKKTVQKARPSGEKQTRQDCSVCARPQQQRPTWKLDTADQEGPFGWQSHLQKSAFWPGIMKRLAEMESMTWQVIRQTTGSHPIPVSDLSKEAQVRLAEIRQDDVDELYSLRVTGRRRLWGIMEGHSLKILWWDPDHKVCPSNR